MLSGEEPATSGCPICGSTTSIVPTGLFRPLQPLLGRAAVKAYVSSLGHEANEWLVALYVNKKFRLRAIETVSQGDFSGCDVPFWHLIDCAKALGAAGFILVHNHPSGDPKPSTDDIRVTRRLAEVSRELNVPLLDHLIIAGDEMREVGGW